MRWFTLFTGIIVVLFAISSIYQHEQVHVQIYKSYGIDSEVDYSSDFWTAYTIPEASCPNHFCTLANNITEAVGYQLQPLYIILGLGLLFIVTILEGNSKKFDKTLKALIETLEDGQKDRGLEQG